MVSVEASGGVAQAIQGTNEPRRHSIYLVTRYLLLLEGVLNLLAGVFEVGLRLVALALIFSALVAGDLADRFLDLAAKLVELVLRLILAAHCVCSYFRGNRPGGRNLSPRLAREPGAHQGQKTLSRDHVTAGTWNPRQSTYFQPRRQRERMPILLFRQGCLA